MFLHRAILSTLIAAFFLVALSPVYAGSVAGDQDQIQNKELQQQLEQIKDLARSKGVVLRDLQVHRSVQLGTSSNRLMTAANSGKSCSASVGTTISATAPTCEQAVAMIADYARSHGGAR